MDTHSEAASRAVYFVMFRALQEIVEIPHHEQAMLPIMPFILFRLTLVGS